MDLVEQLVRDEGIRLTPYTDTRGFLTIGVGRSLTTNGISVDEAKYLLNADINRVNAQLTQFAWFNNLDPVRQGAITNVAFNIGVHGLLHFVNAISALARQDWNTAAQELLNSSWAQQVGARAQRLADQVRTGAWV